MGHATSSDPSRARTLASADHMISLVSLSFFSLRSCRICTEQMDAEGLGRKLLLTRSGDPRRTPEKQTAGTVTASHKILTLQALSSSQCQRCREGVPGPRRGFWVPSSAQAVCPPERPRPFTHYRQKLIGEFLLDLLAGNLAGILRDFFGPTK